jgi:hypothetical protein
MGHLLDAAVFAIFIILLLQIARPASLQTRDIQVWNDDVERRLLR